MERWLSLKVSEGKRPENGTRKSSLLISIPKKIVRLAVRRNRIKRVLREALRSKPFLKENKVYVFKVFRSPEKVSLESAQLAIHDILGCSS